MNKLSSDLQPMGYAKFIHRAHAFFIDSLVFFPFSYLAEYNLLVAKNFNLVVIAALIWIIYKPVMEWKYGATLGKFAAGIRVVNDSQQRPSFNQAMLRFAPYFAVSLSGLLVNYTLFNLDGFQAAKSLEDISLLQAQLPTASVLVSFLFYVFSVAMIFFDEKNQAFHDRISETYCIVVQRNASEKE